MAQPIELPQVPPPQSDPALANQLEIIYRALQLIEQRLQAIETLLGL